MHESDKDTTDLEFVEFLLVHIEGSPSFVSIQKGLNERVPPGSHTWRFCTDILQKEINRLNQQLAEAQGEGVVKCGDCDFPMTPVRPGKYQCDYCGLEELYEGTKKQLAEAQKQAAFAEQNYDRCILAIRQAIMSGESLYQGNDPEDVQAEVGMAIVMHRQIAEAQEVNKYLLEVISHHESQQFNTHQMYYDRVHRIRGTRDKGEG